MFAALSITACKNTRLWTSLNSYVRCGERPGGNYSNETKADPGSRCNSKGLTTTDSSKAGSSEVE